MSSRDFVMWLNGFFELTNAEELTKEQVAMIKEHLSLCFNKITPELRQEDKMLTPYIIPNGDTMPNPNWNKIICGDGIYDPKKLIC